MRKTVLVALAIAFLHAQTAAAVLVYQRATPRGRGEVVVARDDGSRPRRIATGFFPVVAPDGRRVAYFVYTRRGISLWMSGIRGQHRRLLAPSVIGATFNTLPFQWSPDGRYIVVPDGNLEGSLVIDTRTLKRRLLRASSRSGNAAFAPDSRRLVIENVFDYDSSLLLGNVNGQTRGLTRSGYGPAWGRGGIAFAHRVAGPPDDPNQASSLMLIKRVGQRPRRLLSGQPGALRPIWWSRDGRELLVAEGQTPTSINPLVLTPATGAKRTFGMVFSRLDMLSRDGSEILGVSGRNVVSLNIVSGSVTLLASNADEPSWTR